MARLTSNRSGSAGQWGISVDARQRLIGEAAYHRYAQRGYAHGHEVEDWLAAEDEFERLGRRQQPRGPDTIEEVGMQHGGAVGPAAADALKRIMKRHPRREIPRIESVEPEEAPLKE